jgi:methylaspartate ammonia-lyase
VSELELPHIVDVLSVPAVSAYYCEDLSAPSDQPTSDSEACQAESTTRGLRGVRGGGEVLSVGVVLSNGTVAWGDCVVASHAGRAESDPVLGGLEELDTMPRVIRPFLRGRKLTSFRELAADVDRLVQMEEVRASAQQETETVSRRLSRRDFLMAGIGLSPATRGEQRLAAEGVTAERPLHSAVQHGVSQSLLKAAAMARGVTMAEIIAEEWDLPVPDTPVPVGAQCRTERNSGVENRIARRVTPLLHSLVESTPEELEGSATNLTRYTRWLRERIERLGDSDYCPTIHLDVHGALGRVSNNNLGRVLGQVYALELAAKPYPLWIESPVVMDTRSDQLEAMSKLREYVRFRGMNVELIADEWADTLDDVEAFIDAQAADVIHVKMPDLGGLHIVVDAVLACKRRAVGVLLGGSCMETDVSARAMAHVALATRPDAVLARAGMGMGERIGLMQNEMSRSVVEIEARALWRS